MQYTCRHWNASRGEECGASVEPAGDHSVYCPCGPLRTKRHEELADLWGDVWEEAGAAVRRDIYVAEFSTAKNEAWLDVLALGVPEVAGVLFDVTVRHPREQRYMPGSTSTGGHAAECADAEKQGRYPPASGRRVATLAHETWGRLGATAEHYLALAASVASRRDMRRGRLSDPGARLRRWRTRLDAALQRAVAAQLAAGYAGTPGRPHSRRRPVDVTQLELSGGAVRPRAGGLPR